MLGCVEFDLREELEGEGDVAREEEEGRFLSLDIRAISLVGAGTDRDLVLSISPIRPTTPRVILIWPLNLLFLNSTSL